MILKALRFYDFGIFGGLSIAPGLDLSHYGFMDFYEALPSHILIFTDGACSGNPGPGGWGAVVSFPEGHVKELGGQGTDTTNNRMELAGAIHSLRLIKGDERPVLLFTDSTYVIRGITQWVFGWKRRGWKNAEGVAVQNQDLWEELLRLTSARGKGNINWQYVRGHKGVPGNERCDEIAVKMTKREWVDLYDGPLVKYPVAIHDLPDFEALPEMRQNEPKKVAHSYLSYVNGEALRHPNWPSCEAATKGRPGAKFKKAMSPEDEATILAGWGVNPSALKNAKA